MAHLQSLHPRVWPFKYDGPVLDFAFEWLFGTLYGGIIMFAALLAAIPYGIWQGIRRLGAWFRGGTARGNN